MSLDQDLPKAYDPKVTDTKWTSFWDEHRFFQADASSSKPSFSLAIPPPNVTGVLHMGHALVNTLQDILARWKRMSGYETLWIPGTDHAGIATQTIVERHLLATQKKRRSDFSREEFLKIVWEWKEKHEGTILQQLKRLGCSCDWSRLRFTMDDTCNQAVKTLFKKLFEAGLIYRGNYLVNWDPVTQTALADDEVEYEEREGFLWHFKYPLSSKQGFIHFATTRPETLLGDTAVAVHPEDERYRALIGQTVKTPWNREIPIIADHRIDPAFGTGVVKITPAHDPLDYQIGLEHKLEFITVMTPSGHINEQGGPFKGLPREQAREALVLHMQSLGLFEKKVPHKNRIGVSYRSKAIIEPYLSKQWFVKMSPFQEKLRALVTEKVIRILPSKWEHTYFHWIDNLRDWCISRQLWWGHRIPVWHHKQKPDVMICFDGEGLPPEVQQNPDLWEQDPDVLDTWFSSGLWPLSTLGWPKNTLDLQKFYPLSVQVTGHDILFFWVARMLFMGEYITQEAPFPEIFLHGLIYGRSYWRENKEGGITYITGEEKKAFDMGKPLPAGIHSKWEKLSKSKGNVIDPLEMIDDYGTDAVRMSLCASANQSPQIDLDRRRFEEFKNFANKIWNGARFVMMNLEGLSAEDLAKGLDPQLFSLEDRWILSSINRLNEDVNTALKNYSFEQAALSSYDFFWKEFCAYYVEISKPVLFGKRGTPEQKKQTQKILVHVLCNMIRLLHPMAPFITEELFQRLKALFPNLKSVANEDPYTKATLEALHSTACAIAPYPQLIQAADRRPDVEELFNKMEKILYTIRNIRGEMQLPPGQETDVYLVGDTKDIAPHIGIIQALVKIRGFHLTEQKPSLSHCATGALGDLHILIPIPQELLEKEKVRLEKEKERLLLNAERLKTQLENTDFLSKAKPELIEKQKALLTQTKQELQAIEQKLNSK